MRPLAPFLVLSLTAVLLTAGNTVRVSGPQFSFLISEPDGWMLDLESVAQIAHVALYEKGSDWRTADRVIFGRFISRQDSESIEDFLKADEERFLVQCPFADTRTLEISTEGPQDFTVKSYQCVGIETQVVAVTQVPTHFVLFVLTAQRGSSPEPAMPLLIEVLNSFRWLGRQRPMRLPELKPKLPKRDS